MSHYNNRALGFVTPVMLAVMMLVIAGVGLFYAYFGNYKVYAEEDKCYLVGKPVEIMGVPGCDCTQKTNGGECFCIINGPCPKEELE
jgi:hypothetical protein